MKMKLSNGTEEKLGILIDETNVKMLVGEFKIMLDKMQMNIKLTPKELEEHRKFVKRWEADLYD